MNIAVEVNGSSSVALDNEFLLLVGQLKRASRRVGGPDIQVKEMSGFDYAKQTLDNLSELIHQDDAAIIVKLRSKLGIADPVSEMFESLDAKDAENRSGKYLKGARN